MLFDLASALKQSTHQTDLSLFILGVAETDLVYDDAFLQQASAGCKSSVLVDHRIYSFDCDWQSKSLTLAGPDNLATASKQQQAVE